MTSDLFPKFAAPRDKSDCTLVGTCGAKMKVQPVVNVHYLFWERAKSRQFCGGISLQIGCVTGLQALPIGPDMDVYMADDCCCLI